MQLTILGRNGPFPAPGGGCSSYLLQTNAANILLDCGSGCLSNLQRYAGLTDISAVVLSHLHYDHMGDMLPLKYALSAYTKFGLKLNKLPVFLPSEPANVFAHLSDCENFELIPIEDGMTAKVEDVFLTFCAMTHPVPCFATKAVCEGKVFVYSGDTNYNESLVPFAEECDTLLLDCAILSKDHKANAPHLSVLQAGDVARGAGVKRLIATHLFPHYSEEEILAELDFERAQLAVENTTHEI